MCWHGFVLLAKKCDGRVKQNKEMFCSGFAWFVSYGNGYESCCLGYAVNCLGCELHNNALAKQVPASFWHGKLLFRVALAKYSVAVAKHCVVMAK